MRLVPLVRWVLLSTALVITGGCADKNLPMSPLPTMKQSPSNVAASLGPFIGDLDAVGGATLSLPSFPYPEGVKVAVQISGSIYVYSAPQAQYFHQSGSSDPWGVPIGGVYQQCSLNVSIKYGAVSSGPPPNCTPWGSSKVWIDSVVVSGSGTAVRGRKIPYDSPSPCDTMVCNYSSGSSQVFITPLAGDLDLSARYALESRTVRKFLFVHPFTNDQSYAAQTVTFTDSTTPRGLPLQSLLHTWTMADPNYPGGYWGHTTLVAACAAPNPPRGCVTTVKETGIYISNARVNGVVHEDSITVYCAESDSLMNNDKVRQQLLAVLDSSHAASSTQGDRFELYFFVLQDTTAPSTKPYLFVFPRAPGADVCESSAPVPKPAEAPPNTRIIAYGHDHPSEPNAGLLCRDSVSGSYFAISSDGASPDDRLASDSVNSPTFNPTAQAAGWLPLSQYIIDKHNVFVLRPGQRLGQERDPGNMFNWDGLTPTDPVRTKGRCRWPKRVVS
jgi:hypothetical protein